MTHFLNARTSMLLTGNAETRLLDRLKGELTKHCSMLPAEEGLSLYRRLRERLEEEVAWEEGFTGRTERLLQELDQAGDERALTSCAGAAARLAAERFFKRGSVRDLHDLCNPCRDLLVTKGLDLALSHMATPPPAPFCWVALGSAGRQEQGPWPDHDALLVHEGGRGEPWFEEFGRTASATLGTMGLAVSLQGIAPADPFWRGSLEEWRERLVPERLLKERDYPLFAAFADLRPIYGDMTLGERFTMLARELLYGDREHLRRAARRAAAMPLAVRHLGLFRVERGGAHRGEVDLERYGVLPLVTNIALLAANSGLSQRGTVERVRGLLEAGGLSVDQAERFQSAFHEIMRQNALIRLDRLEKGETGGFFDPGELASGDQQRLKEALEEAGSLQKLTYLTLSGER